MKKINIILIGLGLLVATSCSDFLDKDPKGVQSEEQFLNSPNASFKLVVKAYETLNDAYGYEIPKMILNNVCTDESEKGGSDAGDRPFDTDCSYGRATADNEETTKFWTCMFKGIQRCNVALDNLKSDKLIDERGYPLRPDLIGRYADETRFLRAYFNFELCKIFGGLPILTSTQSVATAPDLVRSTEEETAKYILDELLAISKSEFLPSAVSLPSDELGRVTREAVWAMQARVYMYFAKDNSSYFEKAKEAAKKVIDSGAYALEPNYQDLWLPNGYASKEGIFTNIRGDNPGDRIYGSFIPVFCSPRGATGAWGFDQPTQSLVDEFEEGDPRKLFTIMQEGDVFPTDIVNKPEVLDFSTYPSTGYAGRKAYLIKSRRGPGWGDDAWSCHIIRYADILLLYAESIIMTDGNKAEAAEYINMVRRRANASSRTDVEAKSRVMTIPSINLPDVSASDDLISKVRHERRVELGLEYNRLYDLKRWGKYIDTMNNFSTMPYSNGRGREFKAGKNELFPIPDVDIKRTGGRLTQNPGY